MRNLVRTPPAPLLQRGGEGIQRLTLAGLSGAAAAIHGWVIPEHLDEYPIFGLFFAAVTVFQAAWALAIIRRPTQVLRRLAVGMSGGLIGLWALSRSVGLPLGPTPWTAEPVTFIDGLACTLEAAMIVALALHAEQEAPMTPPARRDPELIVEIPNRVSTWMA